MEDKLPSPLSLEAALERLKKSHHSNIDLDSLFLISLLFHLLIFFLLSQITSSPKPADKTEPILVRILDLGGPTPPEGKQKVAKRQEKIPRPQARASEPSTIVEAKPQVPSPAPAPSLPGPKALAEIPQEKAVGSAGDPVDSLIRLPTQPSGSGQASLATRIDPLPPSIAGGGGEAKERSAVASSGLSATSHPDFGRYLELIKKRVQSVWKYPEGISGKHQVNLLFVLDRGGNLVRVELLDSSESKLDGSALQAMKRASPFPPIPDSLKELAGWPLRIRFNIDFGVKVAR